MKALIEDVTAGYLEEHGLFLVDVVCAETQPKRKVQVLVDGLQGGVSIAQCADLSRMIGKALDDREAVEVATLLEVSSPGIDRPFSHVYQYQKHQGREVTVLLKDGQQLEGKLKARDEEEMVLEHLPSTVKKGPGKGPGKKAKEGVKAASAVEKKIQNKEVKATRLKLAF